MHHDNSRSYTAAGAVEIIKKFKSPFSLKQHWGQILMHLITRFLDS